MYIDKIDELIDKIFNDFYLTVILENKDLKKILQDTDYIKYQKNINEIMINYKKKINTEEIKQLVKSNNAVHQIVETLKKYIAFYLFLTIGFFYTGKEELFINNTVEFTKNQGSYDYKIENFFNSDSNSLLIKYNKTTHNILEILNADKDKISKLKSKPEYIETITFLNELGGDYISSKFMLKNLNNSASLQAHNIIKTLLLIFLYKNNDKKDFFKLLETSEINEGEYIYIDIVLPTKKTIDYSAVEKVLESATVSNKDKNKNLSLNFWKYFLDYDEKLSKPPLSQDDKILHLINSGLLVPISDDFLLYHKDSEKYEKYGEEKSGKKKEDTKIKYIVNKLDKIKEYNSEQIKNNEKEKSEIKKLFYQPMLNRKAVLVNIKEDINIINKFINLGRQNTENLDYFRDFEQYKMYPYVNFNDFDKYGMSLQMTKTVDVVRGVSFVKSGEFKQLSNNNIIQTRIGAKDSILNIVGFMIPSTVTPIQCIQIKNTVDIRSLDKKEQNGVKLILKFMRESNLNLTKHKSSLVWLFDEEKDNIKEEFYEQSEKSTMQDKIKHITSYLYEQLLEQIKENILNIFKKEKITIQSGFKIIDFFKRNILDIDKDTDIYVDLEKKLFSLLEVFEAYYDKNEDAIYNIEIFDKQDKNKESYIKKEKIPSVKLNLSSIDEYGTLKDITILDGLCQHNISFENVLSIDKKDYTRYTKELYSFIQQYVIINVNDEPICKSCGACLDIKKYIEEGQYNNETRTFESYSTPIIVNLEEILGYEKYKIAIRHMDKLVEKVSSVSNILHLTKNTPAAKSKRKLIIKNAIDLINSHNNKMKNMKEVYTKGYGINRNYSNFWNFELKNDIFQFSSKDIDKFKPIKTNNVIAYIIFLIILETADTHIMYIGDDKKKRCNFAIFNKVMENLFGGLKIIINKKKEVKNIVDYKILCYVIYIISCTLTSSTKMWYYKAPEDTKKNAIIPMMQKSIIHTLVEIINSVLEYSLDTDEVLYTMINTIFFKKIQTLFADEEIYKRLKKESQSSSSGEKKTGILVTQGFIPLTGKYEPIEYLIPERRICKCATMTTKKLNIDLEEYNGVTNVSNCEDGNYHSWKFEKGSIICELCKVNAKDLKLDNKKTEDIESNFKNRKNEDLAGKICLIDGVKHTFEISANGKNICQKCKKEENSKYSEDELKQLNELILKVNETKSIKFITTENNISDFYDKKIDYILTAVGKLKDEYNKDKKINMAYLNTLMDDIQKTIGNEFVNFNLTENLYIIDHDHIGNTLDKNMIILESQKKIIEKENHPFFKTNVIYYVNHKYGKIEVFYDAVTKILLGYKEENKNYVMNKKNDKRIKLNYSILNKIKFIGYETTSIKVEKDYEKLISQRIFTNKEENNKFITKTIIENIMNNRLEKIKKVIFNLKIVLSRIINGHNEEIVVDDYYKEKISKFIDNYKKKFIGIKFVGKDNNMIFKHWKAIINGVNISNIENIKLDYDFSKQKIINCDEINKIDDSGNFLTYYVYRELKKLFDYNEDDKVLKTSISHFIVDFINIIFDIFNEEKDETNVEIKRFYYALTSSYIQEIEEKSEVKNLEGIYNEYQYETEEKSQEEIEKQEDENYDLSQEKDAFDIDVDMDDVVEDGEEGMGAFDYLED